MAQLFKSRSCGPGRISVLELSPPTPSLYLTENEDEEGEEDDDGDDYFSNPISTPLMIPAGREGGARDERHHFPILEILLAALKKSLVTCSMEREDICAMDISWPTYARHVSHLTFDRYNGILGLLVEFENDVPSRVPSASSFCQNISQLCNFSFLPGRVVSLISSVIVERLRIVAGEIAVRRRKHYSIGRGR
uniref:Uncharacterized protein n=1 Tax=Nelumbo nucifera TaxID=4432 RepID=A0A822ZMZ8_NELNU|nr:TPA_asm: hypothetical protein HUJ06_003095 [Nelumbo nucifera]